MQAIYERSAIVCVSKNMHLSLVYSIMQSDLVVLNFKFKKIENCVLKKITTFTKKIYKKIIKTVRSYNFDYHCMLLFKIFSVNSLRHSLRCRIFILQYNCRPHSLTESKLYITFNYPK
jgi:hypothetical protein